MQYNNHETLQRTACKLLLYARAKDYFSILTIKQLLLFFALSLTACSDSSDSDADTQSEDTNQASAASNTCDRELTDTEQALLQAHNVARASARQCGTDDFPAAAPLSWNCTLAQAASNHSLDMATVNFFDHTGSDGLSVNNRVTNLGYTYQAVGENIAAGQASIEQVMTGWLNSAGHCRNIMNPAFTEMGGNLTTSDSADFSSYWTAVFARARNAL